ncbi:hypothetical protein ABK040_012913 [Willaertia magna]
MSNKANQNNAVLNITDREEYKTHVQKVVKEEQVETVIPRLPSVNDLINSSLDKNLFEIPCFGRDSSSNTILQHNNITCNNTQYAHHNNNYHVPCNAYYNTFQTCNYKLPITPLYSPNLPPYTPRQSNPDIHHPPCKPVHANDPQPIPIQQIKFVVPTGVKEDKTNIKTKKQGQKRKKASDNTVETYKFNFKTLLVDDKTKKLKFVSNDHFNVGINDGPWTEEECLQFEKGLRECGKGKWSQIATEYVKTRTRVQVASHAQKYFSKLKEEETSSKQ